MKTITTDELSTASATHITVAERKAITKGILSSDLLRGLDRTKTKREALHTIDNILNELGFYLDFNGPFRDDKGNRILRFSRSNRESLFIANAGISFTWEKLSEKSIEFVAYVS